jgi:hypothetical protein
MQEKSASKDVIRNYFPSKNASKSAICSFVIAAHT